MQIFIFLTSVSNDYTFNPSSSHALEAATSPRIVTCESLERLHADKRIQVLYTVTLNEKLNQLLQRTVFQMSTTVPTQSVIDLHNSIMTSKTNSATSNQSRKNENNKQNIALPIDLVMETSLYLNENDIYQFEQCRRGFLPSSNDIALYMQIKGP